MANKYYPKVLLCGYERGGTTLLSEIFRNNGYESGFECGVLMCDSPSQFHEFMPYARMIKAGWKLKKPVKAYVPMSDRFEDFYHNIITAANLERRANKFFDKTPVYMKELGKCLIKAPFIEKAIVISRDPRAIFTSWAKRNKDSDSMSIERVVKKNLSVYSNRYIHYFIGAMAEQDNPKVKISAYEDLCINPLGTHQSLGYFVEGKPFNSLHKPSRFRNVYESTVKIDKVYEFDKYLSKRLQNKILKSCAIAAPFFALNNEKLAYIEHFIALNSQIRETLAQYGLNAATSQVDGHYFNPWLLLFNNKTLLNNNEDPLAFFKNQLV